MSDIVIPLDAAIAISLIFGSLFFYPLMKIEKHMATLAAVVDNCPYCMRKKED